jgi:hypothetical protein
MSKFKFTALFPCEAHIVSSELYEKIYKKESIASLDNLRSLLPEKEDFNKNIDLLYVFFNGAIANQFNMNGDGITAQKAVEISPYFINKLIDKEHDRSDVIGHIISNGFSSYDDENKILSSEEVLNMIDPFNMSFGGVIYKIVDEDFSDLLVESNDKNNLNYKKISTSWELGFNDFVLAVGKSRNLKDCRIIEDPREIISLLPYCKAYGGKGINQNGENVFRLLINDIYPLGFGLTTNPAANVKGILALDDERVENYSDDEEHKMQNKNNLEEKISHALQSNVIHLETKENNIEMITLEKIQEIIASASEAKLPAKETAASLIDIVAQEIEKGNKEYLEKIAGEKKEKEEISIAKSIAEKNLAEIKEKLDEVSKELDLVRQAEASRQSEDRFNGRMESLDSEYDFDEKDHKFIATELQSIDSSDESFATYQEKVSVLFAHKNKKQKEKMAKEMQEKVDAAVAEKLKSIKTSQASSVELDDQKAMDEAIASEGETASIPNSINLSERETLSEKFKNAFSPKGIKVTTK